MKKVLVLASLVLISGCVSNKTEIEPKAVGMANPASVYCEQIGGTLEIVDTAQGQVGYCILPSGEKKLRNGLYTVRKKH
nr:Putative hemolysin [Providencia rettgeri]